MQSGKIDTHHHFFPAPYLAAVGEKLAALAPGGIVPEWSPRQAIQVMDELGIAEAILSISAGPALPDPIRLLRHCNDAAADIRTRHPGRFGSFASLPLPDVDASLSEASYAFDTLGADGVILFTNYEGVYLGDTRFEPLWDELARREAIVLIHPTVPAYPVPSVAPVAVLEFTFDTARAALSLIRSGVIKRHPRIRFILSHAGGVLPYLAARLDIFFGMIPDAAERIGNAYDALGHFYYDIALSSHAAPLSALAQIARPERILYGTDYPMNSMRDVEKLDAVFAATTIENIDRAAVLRGNAARLLGRAAQLP